MKQQLLFICLVLLCCAGPSAAQSEDPSLAPLPSFKVTTVNKNKVVISWANPHRNVVQLMVQRSADSLRYFRTIFNAPSPELPENGFTDNNTIGARWFYKITYVLEGGTFFSTVSQRAGTDNRRTAAPTTRLVVPDSLKQSAARPEMVEMPITIRSDADSVYGPFTGRQFVAFRDSILYRTYDTLFAVSGDEYLLKLYKPAEQLRQSFYLFVNKDNLVELNLPDARQQQYRLVIYGADNQPMMDLKSLREDQLFLDKANFIHAGSYYFELWRNGRVLEKNRLYLRKEF